jgi:hypothetical protein
VKNPVSKFAFQMQPAALQRGRHRVQGVGRKDGRGDGGAVQVELNSVQLTHSLKAHGFNPCLSSEETGFKVCFSQMQRVPLRDGEDAGRV